MGSHIRERGALELLCVATTESAGQAGPSFGAGGAEVQKKLQLACVKGTLQVS